MMDIADALQLVLDLAKGNVLEDRDTLGDPVLAGERERQLEAIGIVEDMAVNQFGED